MPVICRRSHGVVRGSKEAGRMGDDGGKASGLQNVNTCTGQIEVPTPRERKALSAMKSAKERARRIKGRLNELDAEKGREPSNEMVSLEAELARLKERWKALEKERDAAAKERMVLLGHETES
jgi:chromosome segregation ATPase